MSEFILNIENVLSRLSEEILSGDRVADILCNPTEFPTDKIDVLSIETAFQYWNGKLTYDEGDCIMNNLYFFWVTNEYHFTNHEFSEVAWKCFDAFDSGEYHRMGDEPDIDPVEKYTKPQIESLLRSRSLII